MYVVGVRVRGRHWMAHALPSVGGRAGYVLPSVGAVGLALWLGGLGLSLPQSLSGVMRVV